MMFMGQSVEQLTSMIGKLEKKYDNATKWQASRMAAAALDAAALLKAQRNLMEAKVCAEVKALRRMGVGRCRLEAVELGQRAIKRRHKFNPMHSFKGLIGRGFLVDLEPQRRTHSMALHDQVVGRCERVTVALPSPDGRKFTRSMPIPVAPCPAAQRRIDRLEAWKSRQGVHAAFNGKMTAGYWVGEARKASIRVVLWRKGGIGADGPQRKRYMQYARIALHGQVYAFCYYNRFVGYITAMSLEAAQYEAENQAMRFSPTAPVEQIRSGIQLKVGY